jgi:serine/threonine protein phosphatase PrpC
MPWKFHQSTDIGGRREQQDRVGTFCDYAQDRHLLVVADGMGGHRRGGEAAETVLVVAGRQFVSGAASDPRAFLTDLCREAHRSINGLDRRSGRSAGSTFAALYLRGTEAHWAHVGDSRLYHFRGGSVQSSTVDHTLRSLLESGAMTRIPDESRCASGHQLYMRLGGDHQPQPSLGSTMVLDGDVFLLCSDGFWNSVASDETRRLLGTGILRRGSAARLVSLARERGGTGGDNIGLVLAQWAPRRRQWFAKLMHTLRPQKQPRTLAQPVL